MPTEEDLARSNQNKDKASSRKRQRENGSQTDKELDGRHCCEASAKLLEMNAKLDKLLTLFGEIESLKTRLNSVEEENKQLKDAVNFSKQDITGLKTTQVYLGASVDKNAEEFQSLENEVLMLKRRNIRLEAYTRRESIKIFNMKEDEAASDVSTESLVRDMFRDKMNISEEDVESIRFERVHRIASRKPSSKPRPIIAKFSFYQDKEFVWSFVKNLKGSAIGIANDFPKEIDEIHQKLYPVLKKAKQAKQSAYFKVDKLIINGQVYRGKETENLEHYGAII